MPSSKASWFLAVSLHKFCNWLNAAQFGEPNTKSGFMSLRICKHLLGAVSPDKFQPLRKVNAPPCTRPDNEANSRRHPGQHTSMMSTLSRRMHSSNALISRTFFSTPCVSTCPSSSLPSSASHGYIRDVFGSPDATPTGTAMRLSAQSPFPKRTASSQQSSPLFSAARAASHESSSINFVTLSRHSPGCATARVPCIAAMHLLQ